MYKKNIIISEKQKKLCYYISGDCMSKIDLIVYNNEKKELQILQKEYKVLANNIYFEHENTKYHYNKEKQKLKYRTLNEQIILDFKNKQCKITLLNPSNELVVNLENININIKDNVHTIEYQNEYEENTKRKIKITLY